jgi:aminotransferase in exopolysaccharide biosynthesis
MCGTNLASLSEGVLQAIRKTIGPGPIPLHEPSFTGNEMAYLKECIDSTFVSSIGPYVDKFERAIESFTGSKYAIAVVNGTSALHISLKLGGVIEQDEVLIPALTFVATANAVVYCGANPHFIESEEASLGIDTQKLRDYLELNTKQISNKCVNVKTNRVIRAIVPMHTFGHPVNLAQLLDIAKEFNIVVIEDAAESLGSFYNGKHTGTFGLLGVLSFNGNKVITTGGGGAILTNDEELARRAKHLTTTARSQHKWEFIHDEVGYNYRMPNLNAALGCAQLEQLPQKITAKRQLFDLYQSSFSSIKGINLFSEQSICRSNYWLQTLILDEDFKDQKDSIIKITNEAGYSTRPVWVLLNELLPFTKYQSMDLTVAKSLYDRIINIPSSPNLVGISS